MQKSCKQWWDALSAYVDGALMPDELSQVEAHVEGCQRCRETLLHLQALRQAVKALPAYEPPPMLKARILSATVDQPTLWQRLAIGLPTLAWRASIAVALILVAWFGWQLLPQPASRSEHRFAAVKPKVDTPRLQTGQGLSRTPLVKAESTPKKGFSSPRSLVSKRAKDSAPKRLSIRQQPNWRPIARHPSPESPAPAEALHGEPILSEETLAENPAAASDNETTYSASEPEDMETTTVARHSFTLPAEVLSRGKSGMEALREQIRIRSQESLSSDMRRKLQRNQLDVEVITVRF